MKILLSTPMFSATNECWMPLGLCYIAAALRTHGHEVTIFDRYVKGFTHSLDAVNDMMCEEVLAFKPDIVGLATYTHVIYDTVSAIDALRKIFTGTVILGGHHSTTFPELTLERILGADMVIAGEGELSFTMLADGVDKQEIPGLFWRENKKIVSSDVKVKRAELDELPLPAYDLLDMDFYTEKNIYTIRSYFRSCGCVISARGCNNRCSFCTESLTFSGGIRTHNVDYVIENIKLLTDKYGCDGITFYDNNFLADKA